jgi:hypothetical protein
LAIVVLVLWLTTAVAGLTMLRAGGASRRRAAEAARTESVANVPVRTGAVPLTGEGKPPPGPHVRVTTPAGEHPLLEFSHPAMATIGIACWTMFAFVHYQPFAWIAFGVLLATIGIGLTWLTSNQRAARRQPSAAWSFPPRLIATHGLFAALSIALTVLTAVVASRG